MPVFTSIKPQRVYVQIVQQVIDLIKKGEFLPGSQLPAERELAQRLGVGRASVREALSALQTLGLVETRSGQGTFVCADNTSPFLRLDASWLYADAESPFFVLQARQVIEPVTAALAAQYRSDEDMERIEGILDLVEADLHAVRVYGEADRKFHLAIAEASGNPILVSMMMIACRLMGQRLWLAMRDAAFETPDRRREYQVQHRRIYEAIRVQDADAARARLRAHLKSVERLMIDSELVSQRPIAATS